MDIIAQQFFDDGEPAPLTEAECIADMDGIKQNGSTLNEGEPSLTVPDSLKAFDGSRVICEDENDIVKVETEIPDDEDEPLADAGDIKASKDEPKEDRFGDDFDFSYEDSKALEDSDDEPAKPTDIEFTPDESVKEIWEKIVKAGKQGKFFETASMLASDFEPTAEEMNSLLAETDWIVSYLGLGE